MIARFVLTVAGLTFLTAGTWNLGGTGWGLAAVGVSCFVLEWTFSEG